MMFGDWQHPVMAAPLSVATMLFRSEGELVCAPKTTISLEEYSGIAGLLVHRNSKHSKHPSSYSK